MVCGSKIVTPVRLQERKYTVSEVIEHMETQHRQLLNTYQEMVLNLGLESDLDHANRDLSNLKDVGNKIIDMHREQSVKMLLTMGTVFEAISHIIPNNGDYNLNDFDIDKLKKYSIPQLSSLTHCYFVKLSLLVLKIVNEYNHLKNVLEVVHNYKSNDGNKDLGGTRESGKQEVIKPSYDQKIHSSCFRPPRVDRLISPRFERKFLKGGEGVNDNEEGKGLTAIIKDYFLSLFSTTCKDMTRNTKGKRFVNNCYNGTNNKVVPHKTGTIHSNAKQGVPICTPCNNRTNNIAYPYRNAIAPTPVMGTSLESNNGQYPAHTCVSNSNYNVNGIITGGNSNIYNDISTPLPYTPNYQSIDPRLMEHVKYQSAPAFGEYAITPQNCGNIIKHSPFNQNISASSIQSTSTILPSDPYVPPYTNGILMYNELDDLEQGINNSRYTNWNLANKGVIIGHDNFTYPNGVVHLAGMVDAPNLINNMSNMVHLSSIQAPSQVYNYQQAHDSPMIVTVSTPTSLHSDLMNGVSVTPHSEGILPEQPSLKVSEFTPVVEKPSAGRNSAQSEEDVTVKSGSDYPDDANESDARICDAEVTLVLHESDVIDNMLVNNNTATTECSGEVEIEIPPIDLMKVKPRSIP